MTMTIITIMVRAPMTTMMTVNGGDSRDGDDDDDYDHHPLHEPLSSPMLWRMTVHEALVL